MNSTFAHKYLKTSAIVLGIITFTLLVLPLTLLADSAPAPAAASSLVGGGGAGDFEFLLQNILTFVNNILIPFILGIGFLVFVFGMVRYFVVGGANDQMKEQGKSLAIYAVLGFVLIIIFWGVVNLIATSIGLEGTDETSHTQSLIPTVPAFGTATD